MDKSEDEIDYDWDSIIDPHADLIEQGKKEGEAAGLRHGYNEGLVIGYQKALEIGVEIGFYRGSCKNILDNVIPTLKMKLNSDPNNKSIGGITDDSPSTSDVDVSILLNSSKTWNLDKVGKLEKACISILEKINDFPTNDTIFPTSQINNEEALESLSPSSESTDITHKLLAIRSKFTVLVNQLRMPKFSLKNVFSSIEKDATESLISPMQMMGISETSPSKSKKIISKEDNGSNDQDW